MQRLLSMSILILLFPFVSLSQVTVYSDCNYRGASANLSPGNYYNSAMFSSADRSLSSIRIPPGYRVELYTGINMGGTPATYSKNISCLPGYMNNKVRSIRITYNYDGPGNNINPFGGVSVFTQCYFRGHYAYLPPGDYRKLSSVIGSDLISSMRIPEGMVIELFKFENFNGPSTGKITSDNGCLGDYWNSSASSARVSYNTGGWIPPPAPPPIANNGSITVYVGCNYFGRAINFKVGEYPDIRYSLNNQPLGSIMIPRGLTVELYSEPNFRGFSMGKYTANKSCMQGNIQYGAASMRVYLSGGNPGGGGSANRGVILYSDCNYSGRSTVLSEGVHNDLNVNGKLSPASLRIPEDYEITLYTDRNLRGTSTGKITSNSSCLGTWIINKARSARVARRYTPSPMPRDQQ